MADWNSYYYTSFNFSQCPKFYLQYGNNIILVSFNCLTFIMDYAHPYPTNTITFLH